MYGPTYTYGYMHIHRPVSYRNVYQIDRWLLSRGVCINEAGDLSRVERDYHSFSCLYLLVRQMPRRRMGVRFSCFLLLLVPSIFLSRWSFQSTPLPGVSFFFFFFSICSRLFAGCMTYRAVYKRLLNMSAAASSSDRFICSSVCL